MLQDYVPVLVLFLMAAGLAAIILGLAQIMGPKGLNVGAEDTYESGIVPEQSARRRFPVRFALVAMSFLIFDIEVVFFYPWAIVFRRLGGYGLAVMSIFIAVLLVGYFYEYKKGAFNWE